MSPIGWLALPDHGRSADELLRHADVAMYGATRDGRHSYRNFLAGLSQPARAGATSRRPRPAGSRPVERPSRSP
jgi:predicted signal transduction protein with EAL and GGDEF domain